MKNTTRAGAMITYRHYPCAQQAPKLAVVLLPYTAKIYQFKRLYRVLNKSGYNVLSIEHSKKVLVSGNPVLLLQLTDEIVYLAEKEVVKYSAAPLVIGSSLGGLMALNLLRRSHTFDQAVIVTGGDIAKVAKKFYPEKWPQQYEELAKTWQEVNMYSSIEELNGKKLYMIIAEKDRIADPADIIKEAEFHERHGNDVQLIVKPGLGHGKRVIVEKIIFPKRILKYIQILEMN